MYRTFFRRLVTQIYSGTVQIYKFQQVGNSIINPPPPLPFTSPENSVAV